MALELKISLQGLDCKNVLEFDLAEMKFFSGHCERESVCLEIAAVQQKKNKKEIELMTTELVYESQPDIS